jgi:hypothetical protein
VVPLDRRAAEGIVQGRPFDAVEDLDAVPYVGPVALDALLAYGEEHMPSGYDCDAYAVFDEEGTGFPSLWEAFRRTHGGTYYLCGGEHRLWESPAYESTLVGLDDDVALDVLPFSETQPVVLTGRQVFDNLILTGNLLESAPGADLTFAGVRFLNEKVELRSATAHLASCQFEGTTLYISGGDATVDDSTFMDAPMGSHAMSVYGGSRIPGSMEKYPASVVIRGGAFWNNDRGLLVSDEYTEVVMEGVDFGWLQSDNYVDIDYDLIEWANLRDDVWGVCSAGCQFDEAPEQ